jgi:hypothetical protein
MHAPCPIHIIHSTRFFSQVLALALRSTSPRHRHTRAIPAIERSTPELRLQFCRVFLLFCIIYPSPPANLQRAIHAASCSY